MTVKVRDLAEALLRWNPGGPPATSWLLPELRTLLRAEFAGAYRPYATHAGWSLEFMDGAGRGADENISTFRSYVAELPSSETFLAFGNPHLVEAAQRNRVMALSDIIRDQRLGERAEPFHALFRRLGIMGHDQLRVLICEGPRQLAWVGATREETFTRRERTVLRRLTRPVGQRLRLEQRLAAPGLIAAALDAALEALPTPAFVVGPRLAIEIANRPGIALLEADRAATLEQIRASARGGEEHGAFSITRLTTPGWPAYLLAVQRRPDEVTLRVLRARDAWKLSVRQARVLELVVAGRSNKEIAGVLGCAEATVETHVTELFRRSGARSRAGLVGLLLRLR